MPDDYYMYRGTYFCFLYSLICHCYILFQRYDYGMQNILLNMVCWPNLNDCWIDLLGIFPRVQGNQMD